MSETPKILTLRVLVQLVLVVLVAPFLPMIVSGRWAWWQAWAYAIVSILSFVVSRALAGHRHPDLLHERARFMEAKDTKPWDKILAPMLGYGSILIPVIAGLDRLYGWSPASIPTVNLPALFGLILGYGFASWALIENRFFSGTVRIQTERGHHVVTTGPYRLVRHPGYAGALLGYVSIPLLLDSLWAYIPAVLLMFVMVVRTALEDRTLQNELPGYREYAQKTRFRLMPGIW
jgi:protein-S-isoprenylcysteine O-methyltransferase Ste14